MDLEAPIEWLRRQGHKVFKTHSSYWYEAGPRVYQAFPYHELITPSDDEITYIFAHSRAIAIRYSTPLSQLQGQISYHVIHEKDNYDITHLHKKARHDVTRGLQYASYDSIPMSRLAQEGWGLREETLIRQGRKGAESKSFWETLCLSADRLPGFEAWGASHDGVLVGALLACTIDDTVSIYYQQSLTEHLKFGINNTLTYVFTREVLQRPGIKRIFYGLHSLDAPSSVDDFKFRMGYSPKPVRQRVVFNPLVEPFIPSISYPLLKVIQKILPTNPAIAKLEGMMRFYLQGRIPLSKQEWPTALEERRGTISINIEQ